VITTPNDVDHGAYCGRADGRLIEAECAEIRCFHELYHDFLRKTVTPIAEVAVGRQGSARAARSPFSAMLTIYGVVFPGSCDTG
jgi:hypothetical protein